MNNYQNSIKILMIISIFLLSICLLTNTINAVNIDKSSSGGIKDAIKKSKPGDTIVLSSGKYTGTNNTGITINKKLTIRGKGSASSVIIDGQKKRTIFTIANNVDITFINITFANGKAKERGGAIYNEYKNSKMTFINCTFSKNTAGIQGGAIYNSRGSYTISNSIFKNNKVSHSAGAIYNGFSGKCSVNYSTFSNNTAAWGAAIFNGNSGYLTVTNSIFTKNTAARGGIINNNPNCQAVLKNNKIKTNTGKGIENLGKLTSKANVLSGNTPSKVVPSDSFKSGIKSTKTKTSVVIKSFKGLYNKSNSIKAILYNKNGVVIAGKQLRFFVNSKLISKVKTDSKGVATFKYTFKTKKNHLISVKFTGDTKYLASNSKILSVTPK